MIIVSRSLKMKGSSWSWTCRAAVAFFNLSLALLASSQGALQPLTWRAAQAPPPAAPVQHRTVGAALLPLGIPSGLTPYSIGEPSDEEQLYLEYINRARRDPGAEAIRLQTSTDPDVLTQYDNYSVDLALMASQVAAIPIAPPLSFNGQLIAAARVHSQDMLLNQFQGHVGSNGSTFGSRATAQGYTWNSIAENVFASATSVEEGHAAFEVDWGEGGMGGMQEPPGHRNNIHAANFPEVGVGVINGSNGRAGPQVVTQDFGRRPGLTPFITGVAYYDLNGNGFYDLNEGLGGAVVLAEGSSFYAVTAGSGGYSVPVPGNANYNVTFRVQGMADVRAGATVAGENVKMDHRLTYVPPSISGPDQPVVDGNNVYSFTAVGGATGYQWRRNRLAPSTGPEGAENGLTGVTALTTPGYSPIDSTLRASGQSSFHFAHPKPDTNSPPEDQFLVLNRAFRARETAQLTFASQLSWASPRQVARAQISVDGGNSWQDLWSQAGTADAGETQFRTQTVSLASFEGREFRLRFVFDYLGGSYFPQTDSGVGFYVDDITLTGADELSDEVIFDLAGGSTFTLIPSEPGSYLLSVRPKIVNRFFAWGPAKVVAAQAGSGIRVRITSVRGLADGRVQIAFSVTNPTTGAYQVQGASDPAGPWTVESSASVQLTGGPSAWNAVVSPGEAPRRFYRIFAN